MLMVGDAGQWHVQERNPLRGAISAVTAVVSAAEAPVILVVEGAHRSCWRLPSLYLALC